MIISKVVNNNLVLAHDTDGQEVVAKGLGIGFQCRKGDQVDQSKLEQIFVPSSNQQDRYSTAFLNTMPTEAIRLAELLMAYARDEKDLRVPDNVLFSLADHIAGLIERVNNGIHIPSPNGWEVKRSYPNEYAVGQRGVAWLRQEVHPNVLDDEAAFIAFHFISHQLNHASSEEIQMMSQVIREVLSIIEQAFQVSLDDDDLNVQRFAVHLKFFIQRLRDNQQAKTSVEDAFYYLLKGKYPQTYNCTVLIAEFLHDRYQYELMPEEMLYLMMHINRIVLP